MNKESMNLNLEKAKKYKERGNIYDSEGRIEDAIAMYSQARVLDRNAADICYKLGNIYSSQGKVKDAIIHYEWARIIEPDNMNVLKALSYQYFLNQEIEASISVFKKIIALQPDYAMIYMKIGFLYIRQGNYKAADFYTQKAWRLFDELDQYTAKNIAHLALLQESKSTAIQKYKAAIPLWESITDYLEELRGDYKDLRLEDKGISWTGYEAVLNQL